MAIGVVSAVRHLQATSPIPDEKIAMAIAFPKRGDGILLRDFTASDAEPLAEIEYDPEVKNFLAVPSKVRAEWIRSFSPDLIIRCAVEALPEHVLAGQASISRSGIRGKGELRIVIAKRFWGRQLGRKAAELLIPAAFEEMKAISVLATVHPDNRASLALVQSLGFIYCGKKEGDKSDWQYGHLIYEVSRAAYEVDSRT